MLGCPTRTRMSDMRKTLATAGLVLLTAVAGCEFGASGPHQAGTVSILLTDAPGDFHKAVVTIDQIYLQSGEGSEEGGRVVLMDDPVTADLLTLQNVAMELVEDVLVPGGTYAQLRLVISGGYIEVEQEDGSTKIYASSPQYATDNGVVADGSLQMPSYDTSGLKINPPGGALTVDGDQTFILLDFNVAESFGQQAGASGMWVMTPVIHASHLEMTGGVEFSLSLAEGVELPTVGDDEITLADFSATLDKNGDVLTESFVEHDGTYKVNFYFLDPAMGDFPVSFVAPEGVAVTLDPEFPATVSVSSGGTFRQAFVITEAGLE
jgi:hypothetical protein